MVGYFTLFFQLDKLLKTFWKVERWRVSSEPRHTNQTVRLAIFRTQVNVFLEQSQCLHKREQGECSGWCAVRLARALTRESAQSKNHSRRSATSLSPPAPFAPTFVALALLSLQPSRSSHCSPRASLARLLWPAPVRSAPTFSPSADAFVCACAPPSLRPLPAPSS